MAAFHDAWEARDAEHGMLSFLPPYILGPFSFFLFALNTLLWGGLMYLVIPAKVLVPARPWRRGCTA